MKQDFTNMIDTIYRRMEVELARSHDEAREDSKLKKELFVFILYDIAMIDQEFHKNEYQTLMNIMKVNFKISEDEIKRIILKAQSSSGAFNIGSPEKMLEQYKKMLSPLEKKTLLNAIDAMIDADGVEDEYEKTVRERYQKILS